jgi:putative SOS response-associated peptidase YedK
MCNLFANTMPPEAMRRLFAVAPADDALGNQPPQPAVFPDAEAPVAVRGPGGAMALRRMRWGFPKVGASYVTNVRNPSAPFWRGWLDRPAQRCLVPATAFSEYHPTLRHAGRKAVAWFARDAARTPFAFAGLWRPWTGERRRGEVGRFDLFAFLTTEPNGLVAPIHPKAMPVVLFEPDFAAWLDAPVPQALALQRPCPDGALRIVRLGPPADEGAAGTVDDGAAPPPAQPGLF